MQTLISKSDKEKYLNDQLTHLINGGYSTFEIFSMFYGLLETIRTSMPNTLDGVQVEVLRDSFSKLTDSISASDKSLN